MSYAPPCTARAILVTKEIIRSGSRPARHAPGAFVRREPGAPPVGIVTSRLGLRGPTSGGAACSRGRGRRARIPGYDARRHGGGSRLVSGPVFKTDVASREGRRVGSIPTRLRQKPSPVRAFSGSYADWR